MNRMLMGLSIAAAAVIFMNNAAAADSTQLPPNLGDIP
jgi:hypothetical protein